MKKILEIVEEENLFLDETNKKGTDKFTKHPYSSVYEPLFDSYRSKPIKFLEIGAYYGASTIIWDKFFPMADITVVDIEPKTSLENIKERVDENRTRILIGNAYTKEFSETLGTFDIINDDGPHDIDSMKKCIELYYPKLNPGGILVIEDIPCSSWFDEFKRLVPDSKVETYDLTKTGASDSRIFIVWK